MLPGGTSCQAHTTFLKIPSQRNSCISHHEKVYGAQGQIERGGRAEPINAVMTGYIMFLKGYLSAKTQQVAFLSCAKIEESLPAAAQALWVKFFGNISDMVKSIILLC